MRAWSWAMAGFLLASAAIADPLPKASQAYLAQLHLDPSILQGIEAELVVPAAWLDGAKREGKLKMAGSWDPEQFTRIVAPFRERYPFIQAEYSRAAYTNRAIANLTASRAGRVLTDVMTGFGGGSAMFKQANLLENLADIPNLQRLASEHMRDPEGFWVGHLVTQWCISYNTQQLAASDLPKTWDDLPNNPKWGPSKLGIGDRPQLWLIALWEERGEEWGRAYVDRLFANLKPQLRKEGMNALISLVELGELSAALPSSGYRTRSEQDKGAPVSFHCPEPVPISINQLGILRNSANPNAAKLFVNWLLSREGQIAQNAADNAIPVNRDLQDERFVPYAKDNQGKRVALRTPEALDRWDEIVLKVWNDHWQQTGR
jgi:iron(III) transport system substrate-binding protein